MFELGKSFLVQHTGKVTVITGCAGALAFVTLFALSPSLWVPKSWHYALRDNQHYIDVSFDEPRVKIRFLGVTTGENMVESGYLMVSGLGFQGSNKISRPGSHTEQMNYAWGKAELVMDDRIIEVLDGGRRLIYRKWSFDLTRNGPLSLVIDSTGQLISDENLEEAD